MKKILLIGAGKSATVLIDYLLRLAPEENWEVTVADASRELALSKTGERPRSRAIGLDVNNADQCRAEIQDAAVVISLLPPALHISVAAICLELGRHLLTASYIDPALKKLAPEIEKKGLLFLCEMGLDPGIDHMSALQLIHKIRGEGGHITGFVSHCGGLVAPESDDNPWHYKISWNPRNIILAGKAGAHYREQGKEVTLGYGDLFARERPVDIPGLGTLCWYPNRDSLSYAPLYGLENTETFIRTTLRHPAFISGWNWVIRLGLTDETPRYASAGRSLASLFREHLEQQGFGEWLAKMYATNPPDAHWVQLRGLGLDDETTRVDKGLCSAADILQTAVEQKWALQPQDRDMIVMLHEITWEKAGERFLHQSSLVVKGEDSLRTAMAKTVGLPLGIAARLILREGPPLTGLQLPTLPALYEPVLAELALNGIAFTERELAAPGL